MVCSYFLKYMFKILPLSIESILHCWTFNLAILMKANALQTSLFVDWNLMYLYLWLRPSIFVYCGYRIMPPKKRGTVRGRGGATGRSKRSVKKDSEEEQGCLTTLSAYPNFPPNQAVFMNMHHRLEILETQQMLQQEVRSLVSFFVFFYFFFVCIFVCTSHSHIKLL